MMEDNKKIPLKMDFQLSEPSQRLVDMREWKAKHTTKKTDKEKKEESDGVHDR